MNNVPGKWLVALIILIVAVMGVWWLVMHNGAAVPQPPVPHVEQIQSVPDQSYPVPKGHTDVKG